MVAVAMGDDGFIYRLPWVNVEVACGAEKSLIGEIYEQFFIKIIKKKKYNLIHCNFRSIHFFDEVDLFILKIIEGVGFGIENEKPAGALADPLHEPMIARVTQQRFHAIERIGRAAAGAFVRLGPLVNHRERQPGFRSHLFDVGLLKDLAQEFMGLHGREE